MAGDSYISVAISLALSFRAKREICFVSREKRSGTAIHGKPDIPFMYVMKVVFTVKNAGRKNFEDLSSRVLLYEIGAAVSPMVTRVSDLNTAFEYRPYICAAQPPPPSLIPSHSFRTAKNIRGMPSAFTQMQAGHGIGAGVVKCTKVRTSWLSSVLGLAGSREAWKGWISRIFFCLSYMFSLRQVGEKD